MVHPNTERLTEYWRDQRGDALAPRRADIDPMAFHTLLPQAIIVGRNSQGRFPFRLAGGLVSDLHRQDLRGRCLLELWRAGDRWRLKSALEVARRRPEPVVIHADALVDGAAPLPLEILLAPLTGPSGEIDRFLGLYQPLASVSQMQGRPIRDLAVVAITGGGEGDEARALRLASLDGRRIA